MSWRPLSEAERALWDSVAKQTKPLRRRPRALKIKAAPIEAAPAEKVASAAKPPRLRAPVQAPPAKAAPTHASPPALGRREKSKIARGRVELDARIDLHGMTQIRAHRALLTFLQRAQADGCAVVLVITGKGVRAYGAASDPLVARSPGVLRRQVPLWLELPEFRVLIAGYEEAGLAHGGAGALYIRLRRVR